MFNGIIFKQGIIKKIQKRKKGINIFVKSELKLKTDLNKIETYIFVPLLFLIIFFGFYPEPLLNTVSSSVNNLIDNYNSNINFYLSKAVN